MNEPKKTAGPYPGAAAGGPGNAQYSVPDNYKTVKCRFFELGMNGEGGTLKFSLGACKYGENCSFAHGDQDLRINVFINFGVFLCGFDIFNYFLKNLKKFSFLIKFLKKFEFFFQKLEKNNKNISKTQL